MIAERRQGAVVAVPNDCMPGYGRRPALFSQLYASRTPVRELQAPWVRLYGKFGRLAEEDVGGQRQDALFEKRFRRVC